MQAFCSRKYLLLIILSQVVLLLLLGMYYLSSPLEWQRNMAIPGALQHQFVDPLIDNEPDLVKLFAVPKYSHSGVPRAMSPSEYDTLMRLVRFTVAILEDRNISYTLTYGSLIGSYLMHDLLPWDDDVDLFVHNDSKEAVMEIFNGKIGAQYGMHGHLRPDSPGKFYKIFFSDSPPAGKWPWNWPFIDILTYTHVNNTIKAVDTAAPVSVSKDDFYPFHKRPFGPLWLNTPRNPATFLRAKYKTKFGCFSWTWNHKVEKSQRQRKAPCESMQSYYPFVKREKHERGTLESLMLNSRRLYSVLINETFTPQESIFTW